MSEAVTDMEDVTSPRSPLCDSPSEEIASIATHAAGVLLGSVVLVRLLQLADGDMLKMLSAFAFGVALILLYLSSTLYHLASTTVWKIRFQTIDHACIYLLIAGTHTPVALVALRGTTGWVLFAATWLLALIGVIIKFSRPRSSNHWISTTLYLVMGWLLLSCIGQLIHALPRAGLAWLIAGGIAYTGGVVFFAWRNLPFNHAIWHLFVLSGSVCHAVTIVYYVFS